MHCMVLHIGTKRLILIQVLLYWEARAPVAKAGGPGFDYRWLLSSSWLTDIDGMICGALVLFGCCQHRYEWRCMVLSAAISIDMNGYMVF